MNEIVINKEELIKLLSKSYENGYYGYLDLAETYSINAIDKFIKKQRKNIISEVQMLIDNKDKIIWK